MTIKFKHGALVICAMVLATGLGLQDLPMVQSAVHCALVVFIADGPTFKVQ